MRFFARRVAELSLFSFSDSMLTRKLIEFALSVNELLKLQSYNTPEEHHRMKNLFTVLKLLIAQKIQRLSVQSSNSRETKN